MSLIKNNALVGASGVKGYMLQRSLRFRSSASAYLSWTPASDGNRQICTISVWAKRGILGAEKVLFHAGTASTNRGHLRFNSDDTCEWAYYNGSWVLWLKTNALFRDPSAWYHIVGRVDTTSGTANLYVNGVDQSLSISTKPSGSQNTSFSQAVQHQIGLRGYSGAGTYYDGYLTEINFIDGQALDPTYFGETDATTGVWKPISYSGTYGTNGFHLNFSDNSTTTTLGYDTSGNSNNWTANNISVTSGATYDSMTDVPTLTSTNAANYCTLNPLDTEFTITNGNLDATQATANFYNGRSTFSVSSGKWYYEATISSLGSSSVMAFGARNTTTTLGAGYIGNETGDVGINTDASAFYKNNGTGNTSVSGSPTPTSGQVLQCALDMDNGKVWFGVNGTWLESGSPSTATNPMFTGLSGTKSPAISVYNSSAFNLNFGQRVFAYTPPTGFKSLNTYNLPDSTVEDGGEYFNTVLYTGNDTTQSITGVGFQPDLVWIKNRADAADHRLHDAVRGSSLGLTTNSTAAESDDSSNFTGFTSDGFNLAGISNRYNDSPETFVAWNWKANGSGVSNTDGSITSTVSANPTAGFSISTFTTPSSFTNATVGHGLGVAPSMIIVRRRTTSDWITWHTSIGTNGYLTLNTTNQSFSNSGAFNGTSSTTWTMGSSAWWQASASDWICYAFAEVEGYSKFGSYTGNGSANGPFVYTGFRPAFLLLKCSSTTGHWVIVDAVRNTYNVVGQELYPSLSNAESTDTSCDFLSNGFKLRVNSSNKNSSGATYIYAAFAENPFKNALAR